MPYSLTQEIAFASEALCISLTQEIACVSEAFCFSAFSKLPAP